LTKAAVFAIVVGTMKKAGKTTGGDCYQVAGRFVFDNPDATLVHAECYPLIGPYARIQFHHAWAERGGVVYDYANGKKIEMDVGLYRILANVQREQRYTPTEVRLNVVKTRHWGPWA
jgi:hypothetical protein